MDQPKMERLLRLMMLLTGNTRYTIPDIANRFDMSERTVYRYIDTFRNAGFVIKKKGECVRIDKSSRYFKDISQLVHFTEEEAYILKAAIDSIDDTNLLKQNLKKKLYSVYGYHILAEITVKTTNGKIVQSLADAIENRRQVILKDYHSSHSNSVADRKVEPFAFTTNFIQVWCFDLESQTNKLFKTARIQDVETGRQWEYESRHKSGYMDVFRFNSDQLLPVKLRLGMTAANLLTEEYPLAARELVEEAPNKWIFDTKVCSYIGICRFYIGLMNDIEIIDSPDFKRFVDDYLQKYHK